MNKKILILSGILYCALLSASAQWTINNGFTATQLGNVMAGSNVTITNASIAGTPNQFGTFNYVGTGFPLNSGVILSTGSIFTAPGPNTNGATSGGMGGPGDPDLTAIAGQPTFDRVAFQFDFEVQSDNIEFTYIFASEEYNEFVGSSFNDVFAFFISGPGITGWQNIALVPGTSVPVAINNINNGSFWQFYRDNETGNPYDTEFDGFTIPMVAKREGLTPCNTYTLRMVIADAGDPAWDAAVFLQANSLVQGNVSATSNTFSANNIALEGCIDASFTFMLDQPQLFNTTIPIGIGGTAINGIDYAFVDSVLVIPAGQTSGTIVIQAFSDGIPEGLESIELYFQSAPCQPYDTVILYIDDYQTLEFETISTDVSCGGASDGELDFVITGGTAPFTVHLTDMATGIQTTHNSYPVTGLAPATYLISVIDAYGCPAEDIIVGNQYTGGPVFIPDGTGQSHITSLPISGLSPGATLQDVNQIQSICLNMEHSRIGELEIKLEAPDGTQLILKQQPGGSITNMGEPCAIGPADAGNTDTSPGIGYNYCFTPNPTYGTMVAESNNHTYSYTTICYGNVESDKYLPAGSYTPFQSFSNLIGVPLNGNWTLIFTDQIPNNNGWLFDWSISFAADPPDSIAVITEPVAPVVTSSVVQPPCGAASGAINISVSGGTGPFTYLWNTGATTQNISGIPAGNYTVQISDGTGCTYPYTFSLSNDGTLNLSASVTPQLCPGTNSGAIDLSVTGHTNPLTYQWSNGANTQDLNTLAPGQYNVVVTDGAGCIGSSAYTILSASQMTLQANLTNEQCGGFNGAIDLNVIGGASPYTYAWSNGLTTQDINSLNQGTYSVAVTDNNNCSVSGNYSIINLVGNCLITCDLSVVNSNATNETCGQQNGSIQVFANSSHLPITYTWSHGAAGNSISGLSAGTYQVTMTDAQGCQINQTFIITNQTGSLSIVFANAVPENCGNGNGSIDISVAGGSLPYSYAWSNGANTQDLIGIHAGQYVVTITDAAGCALVQSYQVNNVSGTLALTYGNAMPASCGQTNGSIDIQISGGQTPYTYLWSNGATTQDLLNLAPGNYQCVITDATGCSISTPVYQVGSATGGLAILNTVVNPESCSNGLGSILLNITGGTTPYNYLWSNGSTSQNIFNLSAGSYSATITDASGCAISTGNINILNNSGSLSLASLVVVPEVCGNGLGSINASVSGGTLPLGYLWNGSILSQDLYSLNSGNYQCVVTDAAGCQLTFSTFVGNTQGSLSIDNVIAIDEICGDGSGTINLIVSGATTPVSYAWSNGSTATSISGLSAGNYQVTVTDASGCVANASGIVQNNSGNLNIQINTVVNEICGNGNGAIDATVFGGNPPYQFLWSNGATTEDIASLNQGTYQLTATDQNGCSVSSNLAVVSNSSGALTLTLVNSSNERCGDGSGLLVVTSSGQTGGVSFVWNTGDINPTLGGISAGQYTITATDGAGCTTSQTYQITNDLGTLSLGSAIVAPAQCLNPNGSIEVFVTGGVPPYLYQWTNGANTPLISGLATGGYQVLITDADGCQITSPVYTVPAYSGNLAIQSLVSSDETCGNGSGSVFLTLSGATNPVVYSWSNGANTQNISGLNAGVYSGSATDANGCSVSFSATVQSDPGTLSLSSSSSSESCGQQNGAIDLTVTGATMPVSYAWSNGATSEDISGLSAGIYTVTVVDANGCQQNWNSVVGGASGTPQIVGATITDEVCGNSQGSIVLTVTGGSAPYTYAWTGTTNCCSYTVNMQDSFGDGWNGGFLSVTVNGAPAGNFSATGFGSTGSFNVCQGDQIIISYTPGAFELENTYTITNPLGQVVVSGGPTPLTGVVYNGLGACSASGTAGSTYTNLNAGQYDVTITDAAGCVTTSSYVVNNSPGTLAITNAVTTPTGCTVPSGAIDITVGGGTTPYSYLWSNGATSQDVSGLTAGTYNVTATDQAGCSLSQTYTITDNTNGFAVTGTSTNDNCLQGIGEIALTITGGTGPYVYTWSNGATTQNLTNLSAGTYSVTVLEVGGCSITETFTVNNVTNGLAGIATVTDDNCNNGIGAVDLTVTGGTPPYTYNWSNGAVSQDISGLSSGLYTVIVSDGTGCAWQDSYTINNSGLVVVGFIVNDASCGQSNGSVTAQVTGGAAPVTYEWTVPPGGCCSYTLEMSDTYGDGWNGGNLNVGVNGTSVGVFAAAGFYSEETFPVCEGDVITLTYAAGIWEEENSYNLVAPSGQVVFSDGINPTTGLVFTGNATCGYTITGTQNYSNIPAGSYTLTVTDANGCSDQATATVGDTPGSLNVTAQITHENCGDGTGAINLTITGNTGTPIIAWQHGPTVEDLVALSAGTYSVTVFDQGCQANGTYTVFNNTGGLNAIVVDTVGTYCGSANGAIDIAVTGGSLPYSFNWSNGATTEDISGLMAGTYSVSITDNVGCVFNLNATLPNGTNGLSLSAVTTPENCGSANGTVDLSITGGTQPYGIVWDHGPTTEDLSGLTPGTYSVTVTDQVGCVDFLQATVIANPNTLFISNAIVTDEYCGAANGGIDITLTGGQTPYTYTWNNGTTTQDATGLIAGTYDVTVTDANGCSVQQSFTLVNTAYFAIANGIVTDASCPTCPDGAIDIFMSWGGGPQPNFVYYWSNGAITEDISGLTPGTYTVVVTDADNGCNIMETFVVGTTTGIVQQLVESSMLVYPNPTNGAINVSWLLAGNQKADAIEVYDITGKLVMVQPLAQQVEGQVTLHVETLSNGMYSLVLKAGEQRTMRRVIVAK